jgi:IclR family acetate operon transcriptional repressor
MRRRRSVSDSKQQNGAQAVYRALSMLDAFDEHCTAMNVNELAARTDLPVPTVHRLANALTDRGYLIRDAASRAYRVGPAISRLAQVAASAQSAFAFVEPLIHVLRDETEETVGLHTRVGNRRVCIREVESPHRVRVVSGVGQTYALSSAAASKAIMAFTDADDLAHLQAEDKKLREAPFVEALGEVRRLGYAISFGETIPGARAVAAPVKNSEGVAIAAINITGPADRLPHERLDSLGQTLVAQLAEVERAHMSYNK